MPDKPIAQMVACPTCRKSIRYETSNPFRPFCSERCKTHDTAAWADGDYRVAGEEAPPEEVMAATR